MKATTTVLCMAVLSGSLAAKAQQPIPTYSFRAIIEPGTKIADHTLTGDTIEDVVLSDSGEVGFLARWTDSGDERSAVFTSRRLVARDGDTASGNILMAVVKGSLAINSAGAIAYEADYTDRAGTPARGIFLEREFVFAVDPSATGNGPDFVLTDDGKIIPRPGIRLVPPAAPQPAKKKGGLLDRIAVKAPAGISAKLPLAIKPNKPDQQTKPQTATPMPAQPVPAFPKTADPCALPAFPMPQEWQIGMEMEGPSTSHVFEPEVKDRKFFSIVYGPLFAPFRIVHFNRACKPLLIAIGDIAAKGRLEVWTPAGLMAAQQPDGSYQFKGFAGTVKSSSFLRADSIIPINRRGQVVLSVTLSPEGRALLLGTPEPR